jgi:hypothetical protein
VEERLEGDGALIIHTLQTAVSRLLRNWSIFDSTFSDSSSPASHVPRQTLVLRWNHLLLLGFVGLGVLLTRLSLHCSLALLLRLDDLLLLLWMLLISVRLVLVLVFDRVVLLFSALSD